MTANQKSIASKKNIFYTASLLPNNLRKHITATNDKYGNSGAAH
jgi:hypothetical protein